MIETIQLTLQGFISAIPGWGFLIALILQILQVFSVFIPSPVIWVPVGAAFGTFKAMLICCGGMVIGSGIVFMLARKYNFGKKFAEHRAMKMLEGVKNTTALVLLMYAIPGFPNGVVPYAASRMNISAKKFMLLVGVASVPNVLLSTGIGDLFLSGNHITALVILIIAIVLIGALMLSRKRIIEAFRK